MFQGFATASGSKFHISEESMKKAEKVLSEENISESKNFTEAKFDGFSTAKGTKFNLSEESLKKGQDIFNDEFQNVSECEIFVLSFIKELFYRGTNKLLCFQM